jgi:peptide/nickel transport system substrate-binding protein
MFHIEFIDLWGALYIMPKHVFEPVVAKGLEAFMAFKYNPPLSLGPYVMHSYDKGGFWTAWKKRDDWKRTPTGMLFGEPAPKYVVFTAPPDQSSRVISQSRHELDATYNLSVEGLKAVLMMNPTSRAFKKDFPWAENQHPTDTGCTFNTLVPPFDNREVRWALTLAIDIVNHIAISYDGAALMGGVFAPPVPLYIKNYIEPMQEWLKDFTIDLGNGETLHPWDPEAPNRLRDYAKARGYKIPEDFRSNFGYGWWKYAPDAAAKLLEKNGFKRDKKGKWLLPDGTPWKFSVMTNVIPGTAMHQNALALAHAWKKFGIDVEATPNENYRAVGREGKFSVHTWWPGIGGYGGHVSNFRTLSYYDSSLVQPEIGKARWGHQSSWHDPRMDQILSKLRLTDWADTERTVELTTEAYKILIEEMGPGIPTFAYPSFIAYDTYYWTGWPTGENSYMVPHSHWPNFKYVLPFLKPTGR